MLVQRPHTATGQNPYPKVYVVAVNNLESFLRYCMVKASMRMFSQRLQELLPRRINNEIRRAVKKLLQCLKRSWAEG